MLLIFLGGITSGWPPQWEVLPGRFRIDAFESGVDRQGTVAAKWFAHYVGPGRVVACDFTSCTLLGAYADATPIDDASNVFYSRKLTPGLIRLMRDKGIQYVLVDDRLSTQTPITGTYFRNDTLADAHLHPVPVEALHKFAHLSRSHLIYDSGLIQIYDVRGLTHVT